MKTIFFNWVVLGFIVSSLVFSLGCSGGGGGDGFGDGDGDDSNCEVVINANGPGFLKVINKTNGYIMVFLKEYALGAHVRPHVCEIYGMAKGTREIEISRCDDDDCDDESSPREITFNLDAGETYVVEVTDSFFMGTTLTSSENIVDI